MTFLPLRVRNSTGSRPSSFSSACRSGGSCPRDAAARSKNSSHSSPPSFSASALAYSRSFCGDSGGEKTPRSSQLMLPGSYPFTSQNRRKVHPLFVLSSLKKDPNVETTLHLLTQCCKQSTTTPIRMSSTLARFQNRRRIKHPKPGVGSHPTHDKSRARGCGKLRAEEGRDRIA